MDSISMAEWAESLVGRDWEIYWNSDDDADQLSEHQDYEEDNSQGSFIDDWYAGRVLEAIVKENGTVVVRVLFVGDEQIYEMELSPAKVRPSARGWIKRTTALLSRKGELPPDTATPDDHRHIQSLQAITRHYEPIPSITPPLDELNEILELKRHVQAQIYLRSKLATIVNLHGSIKYIDGEPNPTEPLVNHLRECCGDLEHACDWYLRCWELLTTCFGQKSGQSSNESDCQAMDYEKLLEKYLEYGKNCILNCAMLDLESTTSKRRQLVASPQRRPKRRRKQYHGQSEDDLDTEGDFRCTTFVDYFVQKLSHHERWYLPIFAKMLQILSHSIINPLVHWRLKANQLMGRKDDLEGILEEDDVSKEDDIISIDSVSEHDKVFSYQDVEACLLALESNPILSLVDLSNEENALQKKLQDIEETALKVRALLARLGEESIETPCDDTHLSQSESDPVLEELETISQELNSPGHSCYNMDPIGKPGASVTRSTLVGAKEWRLFLLEVRHAICTRERKCFLEHLGKRMQDLPDLLGIDLNMGNFSDRRVQVEQQVHLLLADLEDVAAIEEKFTGELNRADPQESNLLSIEGAQQALLQLEKLPVLLLVEEKISLRLALMEWREKATESLSNDDTTITFLQLESLYQSLQLIYKGESKTRCKATSKLRANEKIESQIRQFVTQDVQFLDSSLVDRVKVLYLSSLQWKEKAEAIIFALRMHGNGSVGDAGPCLKLPAMVDVKRITDLVSEYDKLGVEIPGYTATLKKVLHEAICWSSRVETELTRDHLLIKERLQILEQESHLRPKGLIMDPTRQVMETLADLLEWHCRSKEALDSAMATIKHADDEHTFSDKLVNNIYPVLAEGIEVVELFSQGNKKCYEANAEITLRNLQDSFHIRRSTRSLSRERIELHPLGVRLLNQIVNQDFDIKEGSPLNMYVWFDWHLAVTAFVRSVDERQGSQLCRTRTEAEALLASQPAPEASHDNSRLCDLGMHISNEVKRLEQLIHEARDAESCIRELMSKSRDLRKGSLQKADYVRRHLSELKEQQTLLKERSSGNHGLLLDSSVEALLDHHSKIFSWIVRTFSYPFLYLDEASYSAPMDGENDKDTRIPLDVLVSLFERLPGEEDVHIDDFALVSMRVRELHEAATKWQDEISRTTMLSNRGGKRRAPINISGKVDQEIESSSKLQIEKMKQLAANPILSKVVMPREGAVNGILRTSEEFESKLHAFLSMDFDGPYPDRAAYPNSHSLVGRTGEFILFRLTMGELFESVLESVNELSSIAENVHAETPEKVTFEWIKRAVSWIEQLNDSVTDDSPFNAADKKALVIPEEIGRVLLQSARSIFLDVPDDLKKTLSQHGIFVSTNKQDQNLRVVLKKDGAHHSVGGTVIRWCPILFECLRADLTRLDHFRKELEVIFQQFTAFYSRVKDEPKDKEENLYKWFCYHERASALLDDGARSLVVAPKKTFVDAFNNLRTTFRRILDTHSTPELEKKFAKMWFMEGTSLLDDRFLLLESLLHRKSIAADQIATDLLPDDASPTFRDICRSYLVASLTEALKSIGMTGLTEEFDPILLETLCSMKAWEIEGEMYIKFQDEIGVTRVSEDYRSKARNLKASLSDKNNISLCLRILLGDISSTDLVKMSKNELASQRTKLERARAEKEFRSAANLTPGIGTQSLQIVDTDEKSDDIPNDKSSSSGKPASILRHSKAGLQPGAMESWANNTLGPTDNHTPTNAASMEVKVAQSSEKELVTENSLNRPPDDLLKRLAKPRSVPPPPPPSLVTAFQQSNNEDSEDDTDNGHQIINESGGIEFHFESAHLRVSFDFNLYLENGTYSTIDRFLQSSLTEKGRVPGKEFAKFVSQKTSGSWIAIPLRVKPISDKDDREIFRLCQAYEAKDRVPMISLNTDGNTKLFFVIPHFHGAASKTGGVSFSSKTSSYVLVLTKDTRFEG